MKLPRVRLTVRRMLLIVMVAALVVWLGLPAYRIIRGPGEWMFHASSRAPGALSVSGHVAPFWPRYWRMLLNHPWPGSYECSCEDARIHGLRSGVTLHEPRVMTSQDSSELDVRAWKAISERKR